MGCEAEFPTGLTYKVRVEFRFATSADVPLIAEMNRELMQDEGHADVLDLGALEDRMRGWLAGEYRAVLFEQGGEVVAYALLRPEGVDTYLRQFFVRRHVRRRGVGREAIRILLATALAEAPRITLDVLTGNGPARVFWEAVGFREYAIAMELRPGRARPPSR